MGDGEHLHHLLHSHNGVDDMEPSVPAPVRAGGVAIEIPASLDTKMTLNDFHFLKVLQGGWEEERGGEGGKGGEGRGEREEEDIGREGGRGEEGRTKGERGERERRRVLMASCTLDLSLAGAGEGQLWQGDAGGDERFGQGLCCEGASQRCDHARRRC